MAYHRHFCLTEKGHLGWIPEIWRHGDMISVLAGSDAPVLLRPTDDGHHFVGTCYIHGIMNGEAIKEAQQPMQELLLV